MPLTPVSVASLLLPSLASASMAGVGVPKIAQAMGIGLTSWTAKIKVRTVDVGTLGSGAGAPTPVIVPSLVVYANLTSGFLAQGILGMMAPAFIQGLSTGISQVYATALLNTTHASVGVGSGQASFSAPPAFSDLKQGFDAVGATGDGATKLCRAIAQGLESTFSTLVVPQPITGPSTPYPGSGVGVGKIL